MTERITICVPMRPATMSAIDSYRASNGDQSRAAVIRQAIEFFLANHNKFSLMANKTGK